MGRTEIVITPTLRDAIPDLVSRAGSCIQGALALAKVRGDERSLLGGAAIATLHDSLCGVLRLLNTEAEWCADLITRSMIEAYSHAAGLALKPGYERRMALESHCKQSELYRDLGIEDAADRAEWHSAQAEILRKSGVQRLSIRDRFRAADFPETSSSSTRT